MTKVGGIDYSSPMSAENIAPLVADIVSTKLNGNYANIEPEVVGGWNISIKDQTIQHAETIADAVIEKIGVRA